MKWEPRRSKPCIPYRKFRFNPWAWWFRRINPLAEPSPVLAPVQAVVEQDLVGSAALHRDAFLLMPVGG
jgi:hypothetical protein